MPVCRDCVFTFSFPTFKHAHVCNEFKYLNRSFGAIIPQVAVELMKLVTIIRENISEVGLLNAAPSREAMKLL